MNADTVKQIQEAVTPLAQKIGEGAAHLYEIYVRQMVVEGITALVLAGVGFLIVIAAWVAFAIFLKKEKGSEVIGGGVAVLALITLFAGGLSLLSLPEAIGKMINPEYYAIQRLIETVKN